MPYTPQTWTNGVSKLNAARMTVIETGIDDAHTTADAAIPGTLVDAKGDLIVATAADTVARRAVGANDEVLVADSAQSTGVKWSKIGNAMVAADAAIAVSKLAAGTEHDILTAGAAGAPAWSAHAAASYTPTWTQSTSNPTLGNGTISGSYARIGALILARVTLSLGTTTSLGTGRFLFSTPVTIDANSPMGTGYANDVGTAIHMLMAHAESSTKVALRKAADGALVDESSPFAWSPAAGDTLAFTFVCLAA